MVNYEKFHHRKLCPSCVWGQKKLFGRYNASRWSMLSSIKRICQQRMEITGVDVLHARKMPKCRIFQLCLFEKNTYFKCVICIIGVFSLILINWYIDINSDIDIDRHDLVLLLSTNCLVFLQNTYCLVFLISTYCTQGCISCGILVSGIWACGVSSEHMENMEMFSCSPT